VVALGVGPRLRLVAGSVLDGRWIDEVDAARGGLLAAQGLLMYLEPDEVHGVVEAAARRLPAGALVFDAAPRWLSPRAR
jgi:O-methyltransferase involved in polyketide biosynthesis